TPSGRKEQDARPTGPTGGEHEQNVLFSRCPPDPHPRGGSLGPTARTPQAVRFGRSKLSAIALPPKGTVRGCRKWLRRELLLPRSKWRPCRFAPLEAQSGDSQKSA